MDKNFSPREYLREYNDSKSLIENEIIFQELDSIPHGSQVLELACGLGVPFTRYMKESRSSDVLGVDFDPLAIYENFWLSERKEFKIKNFDFLSPEYFHAFDAVVNIFGVYGDNDDLSLMLSGILSCLKDNGVLIMVAYSSGRKDKKFGIHSVYGGYVEFTKGNIEKIFAPFEYEVKKCFGFSPAITHYLQFLPKKFLRWLIMNPVNLNIPFLRPEYFLVIAVRKNETI